MGDYHHTFNRFVDLVKVRKKDATMMAIIIDSPWMPGYLGINTLDFYFDPHTWLQSYLQVVKDLPDVAFIPGSWIEFGMAAEPSGWGIPIEWSANSPPSLHHFPGSLDDLLEIRPDPEKDGLMPIILRQYERMQNDLNLHGIPAKIAAARGPLTVASYLIGVSDLLLLTKLDPDKCLMLVERTTELCIRWLHAQLQRMDDPVGILVLDDMVGMMSPADAAKFAFPFLTKIFDNFPNLIHIFHNDTPNEKVFPGLSKVGIDVFNFSHETDLKSARELLGDDIVILGNIPPLEVFVNGSAEDVTTATGEMVKQAEQYGPLIISAGGGISPGTPIKNLQRMAEIVSYVSK